MSDLAWDDEEEENAQENQYLMFNLGPEVYGVPITHVINIIERQKITEVPDLPPFVRGVINLRGSVIPVMDLRLRFHLPFRDYDDRTCIVIVKVGTLSTGWICDTVAEVARILPENIEPPVNFRRDLEGSQYIAGLGKVGEEVRILLDVEKILSDEVQLEVKAT